MLQASRGLVRPEIACIQQNTDARTYNFVLDSMHRLCAVANAQPLPSSRQASTQSFILSLLTNLALANTRFGVLKGRLYTTLRSAVTTCAGSSRYVNTWAIASSSSTAIKPS